MTDERYEELTELQRWYWARVREIETKLGEGALEAVSRAGKSCCTVGGRV